MIELISIHIPKTAGRSFLSILNSVYPENAVAHFDQNNYKLNKVDSISKFKTEITEKTTVIHGHFTYENVVELNIDNKTKVISWLRNPVDRVISNFSFFKKRISLAVNDKELSARKNETLLEYASLENSRNRMSKFLLGQNLSDYYFIGIMEYFDEDVKQLGELMQWREFKIPKINNNYSFKSQLPEVTNAERLMLNKLNADDIELYNEMLTIRKKRII